MRLHSWGCRLRFPIVIQWGRVIRLDTSESLFDGKLGLNSTVSADSWQRPLKKAYDLPGACEACSPSVNRCKTIWGDICTGDFQNSWLPRTQFFNIEAVIICWSRLQLQIIYNKYLYLLKMLVTQLKSTKLPILIQVSRHSSFLNKHNSRKLKKLDGDCQDSQTTYSKKIKIRGSFLCINNPPTTFWERRL